MLISKQLLVAEFLSIQAKSADRPVEFVVGVGDHAKTEVSTALEKSRIC